MGLLESLLQVVVAVGALTVPRNQQLRDRRSSLDQATFIHQAADVHHREVAATEVLAAL